MKHALQDSPSKTSPPKKQAQSITKDANLTLSGLVEMARIGAGSDFERQILAMLLEAGARPLAQRYFTLLAHADLSRLARCAVCGLPFIRTRKDSKCCNEKCANVFRVRKCRQNREKSSDKYKQARIRKEKTDTKTDTSGIVLS